MTEELKNVNCIFTYGQRMWAAELPEGITVSDLRPRHGRNGDGRVKWWVWKDPNGIFQKLNAEVLVEGDMPFWNEFLKHKLAEYEQEGKTT